MLRLETPRLILRPPRPADAPAIQAIASLRAIADMTAAIPHPYPPDGAASFIASLEHPARDGRDYHVAIERREDGVVMGMAGLFPSPTAAGGQIGYYLGPEFWRQGYATEAAGRLVRYAFDNLGLDRMVAHVYVGNEASMRVLRRLGFAAAGQIEVDAPARGGLKRVALFERRR